MRRLVLVALFACSSAKPALVTPEDRKIHDDAIVVDMHSGIAEAMFYEKYDLFAPHSDHHEDYPRMKQGGLDAAAFSVFVHPESVDLTEFFSTAMKQIDLLQQTARNSGGRIAFARNAAEVQDNAARGVLSMLIGVGGGHMLLPGTDDEQLAHLKEFANRGVRYMTLSWSSSSPIGGSTATEREEGLTDFGKRVIPEMERLGIVPDLSHGSDALFRDVMRIAKKPVFLTNSGARALSNHPRNASDEMLQAVARNGGAVCVDFSRTFLDTKFRRATQGLLQQTKGMRNAEKVALYQKQKLPDVPLSELIDHIEHVAKVAGYDHVCLGSSFDEAPMMPNGLEDVSKLPAITALLRQRGWTEANIRKVLGENALRVLQAAESP
jgi:membrane dipeptidase